MTTALFTGVMPTALEAPPLARHFGGVCVLVLDSPDDVLERRLLSRPA
ncbi:hypothetical protein [Deinococcus hopiensis]|nr:hypothetical protein [Deinococcus hopiensis]